MGKSTVDASAGFGLRDKLAYAAGDFGCNMSFALKGYLTIYWTQFMGIDNYLMASLLLIVQIWDAINDPIIGAMVDADTHKYRRNKFLAYIWFGAIGLTVAGALCYLPFPQAPGMVKNILFVAGYMIWDAFYTVANVPYGSMLSLISDDPIQRAQLSTFRSIGSMGGGIGSCLSWSLMADAIDYNEWKFGVREEGTTYALHSFFRKLAQGIGPSLGLVLATKLGYDASLKAAQTIEVATRMRYLVPVMYLGSYIVMIIAYGVVFNLDKKTLAQMESDLKERRAKNEK